MLESGSIAPPVLLMLYLFWRTPEVTHKCAHYKQVTLDRYFAFFAKLVQFTGGLHKDKSYHILKQTSSRAFEGGAAHQRYSENSYAQ